MFFVCMFKMWSISVVSLTRMPVARISGVWFSRQIRCISSGAATLHKRRPKKKQRAREQSAADTFGTLTAAGSPLHAAALQRADSYSYWHDERQRRRTDRQMLKGRLDLSESLADENDEDLIDFRSAMAQPPNWYLEQCEQLVAEGKLAESVALLTRRMITLDKVMPDTRIFNVNLKALAAEGHAQDAFKLFKQMVEMGVRPSGSTYTNLLNACANSKDKHAAVDSTEKLLEVMRDIGKPLARLHCHAAIKVFAKHNEWDRACRVYRTMCTSAVRVDSETLGHLLLAALADRQHGFVKMLAVNVMLSICRRCSAISNGSENATQLLSTYETDLGVANDLTRAAGGDGGRLRKGEQATLPSGVPSAPLHQIANIPMFTESEPGTAAHHSPTTAEGKIADDVTKVEAIQLTHLLLPKPVEVGRGKKQARKKAAVVPLSHFGEKWHADVAEVFAITTSSSWGRFQLLFGDFAGFSHFLEGHRIELNAHNVTQLVDVLPTPAGATAAQIAAQYETLIERCNVKVDVTLCNALVDRLCIRRYKYDEAKELLSHLTRKYGVAVDDHSWRMLAMTCTWWPAARELLQQMQSLGVVPNEYAYGSLIANALHCKLDKSSPREKPTLFYRPDFQFAINVLNHMRRNGLRPTPDFARVVDRKLARIQKLCGLIDRADHSAGLTDEDHKKLRHFMALYNALIREKKPTVGDEPVDSQSVTNEQLYSI